MDATRRSSVVPAEVKRFGALAATWWDPDGPMAPLHAMNPLRTEWVDGRVRARLGSPQRLLDLGCGAGLASEAFARMGYAVTGLDADAAAIDAARAHAGDLPIAYRVGAVEDLNEAFPVVTALEVIEHVDHPASFLRSVARVVEPGGLLFVSTLNRTAQSLAVAKIGAEYIARLLPVGTHDWRRFITPAELAELGRAAGFRPLASTGMTYDVARRRWYASADRSINYLAALVRYV